jgi:ubiquitin carboxyl-terminal hydrolase 25/28
MHASTISVEPQEAPEDYILELHKNKTRAATSASERSALSQALTLIGRDRNSDVMIRLGENGQSFLSVNEAFSELSAPLDSVDEGLIM